MTVKTINQINIRKIIDIIKPSKNHYGYSNSAVIRIKPRITMDINLRFTFALICYFSFSINQSVLANPITNTNQINDKLLIKFEKNKELIHPINVDYYLKNKNNITSIKSTTSLQEDEDWKMFLSQSFGVDYNSYSSLKDMEYRPRSDSKTNSINGKFKKLNSIIKKIVTLIRNLFLVNQFLLVLMIFCH